MMDQCFVRKANDDRRDDGGEKVGQSDPQKRHDAAVLGAFHVRGASVHAHAVSAPADDRHQCPDVPGDSCRSCAHKSRAM